MFHVMASFDPKEYDYEVRMGMWVTARCVARAAVFGKPMPDYVKVWLDTGGNSPPDGTTEAPPNVMGWLVKTIEDPDWPRA